MGTTHAAVLRKANAAMRAELTRLDLADGCFCEPPEFLTLLFRNRRSQVLDLRRMLSHEDDQGYVRYSSDPGIANQLGIQRKQAFWVFRITTRRCLPIDQATSTINFANRVEVSDKLASFRKGSKYFDLEIFPRVRDADPIILDESLEQVNPLMHQTIPGFALFIFESSVTIQAPFLE